jgi:sugar lactone lactonase YvrE
VTGAGERLPAPASGHGLGMNRRLPAIAAAGFALAAAGAATASSGPTHIDLPAGWQPEGIAAGRGHDLYVGSIPTGAVRRVDARTGEQETVVPAREGHAAIGLKAEHRSDRHKHHGHRARASHRRKADRLWVAGGGTGKGFVYSTRSGAELKAFEFTAAGAGTFVNDVVLTKRAAYFTDSRRAVLYVAERDLSGFSELALPDIPMEAGNNLNGIVAGRGVLLAVQTNTGKLWRIDPKTGAASQVDLGATLLTNGDGMLLEGRRLYVVQNRSNQVAVLRLSEDFRSGTLETTLTSEDFDVPTTIARKHGRLYLPNARFGTAGDQPAAYWLTALD